MRVLAVTNMFPTPTEPWFGCFVKEQIEDLRAAGVGIEVLHFDGRQDWTTYVRAAFFLRRLVSRGQFDLVHAHYGLTGAVAITQRQLPVVTTFWGGDTGYIPWQRHVSWAVARLCTPVFVAARNARQLGLDGCTVVPSAVDTTLFRPIDRRTARRQLGWPEEISYALFPASRSRRVKRVDLFDAAVRHAQRTLPELRSVSLEGLSRAEVALVMNAVNVTVLTSNAEGSPLAVKESLACATPVVSVDVGDVSETVAGLPGCAVVARTPEALSDAMVEAVRAGRPTELRQRAESYSASRIAGLMLAVYERVLGRP